MWRGRYMKYTMGFELPDGLLRMEKILAKLDYSIPVLNITSALENAVAQVDIGGISRALIDYTAISDSYAALMADHTALLSIVDQFKDIPVARIAGVAEAILPTIDLSYLSAAREATALAALVKNDWSWISKAYRELNPIVDDEEFFDPETEEGIVTPEVKTELAADIQEVLVAPELSKPKYLVWKERHPLLADIFLTLILSIISGVASGLIVYAITAASAKNAKVYEEPSSSSNIVYNVTVNQDITIIREVPYYYEVEIVDPETGETKTGYIYKANVTVDETIPEEKLQDEADIDTTEPDAEEQTMVEPVEEVN